MTVPMRAPVQGDIMESVLIKGDLGKLTPQERVQYYGEVCRSVGLNPLTKPFEFIVLNGKLQLYALRTCADQLRKINGVSLEIVSRDISDGIMTVHVRAKLPDGRSDEDLGSVAFPDTLRGEARANAELKAVTKAKRRATLSICGLGWLDETEIADIPASAKRPAPPAANVMIEPPHDQETGEIIEPAPTAEGHAADPAAPVSTSPAGAAGALTAEDADRKLAEAAKLGTAELARVYKSLPAHLQDAAKVATNRRHKPAALEADRAKLAAANET